MMERDSTHVFSAPGHLHREGPEVMQAFFSRYRAFLVLVAVIIAQLLMLSLQITRGHNVRLIQVWAVAVFDPFERSMHWTIGKTTGAWRHFSGLWGAQEENQQLHSDLAAANSRVLLLSEKAAEGDRLRALLDFKDHAPFQTIAAEVIAASPGEKSSAVFISKGAEEGLTNDLAVITPEGIVGKIIAIFPHSAQVLLISDPSSGVGCILEKSRLQGVLKGTRQSSTQLHYIMDNQPVAIGETVLTSGLDQIYPKGLPVGVVSHAVPGSIYQEIVVTPTVQLDRLETVLVVPKIAAVPSPTNAKN
jgi:rod shape-determining protein MreC